MLHRTKVLAHWRPVCSWCTHITILTWYSIHARRPLTSRYSITSLTGWREKGEGGRRVEGGIGGEQGSKWGWGESGKANKQEDKVEEEKISIWESHRLPRWATLSRESTTSLRTLKKVLKVINGHYNSILLTLAPLAPGSPVSPDGPLEHYNITVVMYVSLIENQHQKFLLVVQVVQFLQVILVCLVVPTVGHCYYSTATHIHLKLTGFPGGPVGPGSPGWPYHCTIHYIHTHFKVDMCVQTLHYLRQLQVFQKFLSAPAVKGEYR